MTEEQARKSHVRPSWKMEAFNMLCMYLDTKGVRLVEMLSFGVQ